jgi:hypothetical protein
MLEIIHVQELGNPREHSLHHLAVALGRKALPDVPWHQARIVVLADVEARTEIETQRGCGDTPLLPTCMWWGSRRVHGRAAYVPIRREIMSRHTSFQSIRSARDALATPQRSVWSMMC